LAFIDRISDLIDTDFSISLLAMSMFLSITSIPVLLLGGQAAPHSAPSEAASPAETSDLMALYRDLHAHPELSGHEERTSATLATALDGLGFEITRGVGGHGLVAVLQNGKGPAVLLRTDMDALPVTESTGLPFASTVRTTLPTGEQVGIAHACGHDAHMAAWVGTARALARRKRLWSGTLVLVAQPAEETGTGAKAMLDDGLYSRFPEPSVAIAWHTSASLPAGQIGWTSGYVNANVDTVDLVVHGVGGHGAYPHLARDPVLLASRIVVALQSLVSREIDPQQSAVLTVGSINGGTKHNIIPDSVKLQITIRSYDAAARKTLVEGVDRIARGEAIAAGIPDDRMPKMTIAAPPVPAVFNSEALTKDVVARLRERMGADRLVEIQPLMGGEDFSQYALAGQNMESLMLRIGTVRQADWKAAGGDITRLPSLHSARYSPDAEPTIATAVTAMTEAAIMAFAR